MAGNKLSIKSRVSASTLMEAVVSMVIIISIFTIAMMIFTNVSKVALSGKKLQAEAVLQGLLDDNGNSGDFRITRETTAIPGEPDLEVLHLCAYDSNDEKIAEVRKIIIKADDHEKD